MYSMLPTAGEVGFEMLYQMAQYGVVLPYIALLAKGCGAAAEDVCV